MSMSKRDFAELAQAIAKAESELDPNDPVTVKIAWENLKSDVAALCAKHNSKFDRQKFLAACQAERQ